MKLVIKIDLNELHPNNLGDGPGRELAYVLKGLAAEAMNYPDLKEYAGSRVNHKGNDLVMVSFKE